MEKISNKRIVCPAHAFNYFEKKVENGGCRRLRCCYHCNLQMKCEKGGGCSRNILENYPEKCDSYPISFGELKNIWIWFSLLENKSNDFSTYFKYLKKVEEYINAKKEKK